MKLLMFVNPVEPKAVARFLFFVNKLEMSSTTVVGESSLQRHYISLVLLFKYVEQPVVVHFEVDLDLEKQVRLRFGSVLLKK